MLLPIHLTLLENVANLSANELDKRFDEEQITEILWLFKSPINASFSMNCPRKYIAYIPRTGGSKDEKIARLASPDYDSMYMEGNNQRNKSKLMQKRVLDRLLSADLSSERDRHALSGEGWKISPDSSGQDISHWCFGKAVVEHFLVQEYGSSKGNPFTFFKLSNRRDACRDIWINNLRIEYRPVEGENMLGFNTGFVDSFAEFVIHNRNDEIHFDSTDIQSNEIFEMQFTEESDAEAHNFSIIWYLFQDRLKEFFGIPENAKILFKGGHRMKTKAIGQTEIDAGIVWISDQRQGRIIVENKGFRSHKKGWSDGFSIHQLTRPALILRELTSTHELPCEISTVFCRFEYESDGKWNALLDMYEINQEGTNVIWLRSLDIRGIPINPETH